MNQEAIATYEAQLLSKHTGTRKGAIALKGGGQAYLRAPSHAEFMFLQSQTDAPHDIYVPAFAKYVQDCFLGACDGEGNPISYEQIREAEGPAFVTTGPFGEMVNRLSGQRKVVTREL